MVSRENVTLCVGFLVGATCFVAAGVRGLHSPLGMGAYLLATVSTGIGPQLYLCSVDRTTSVSLRVRTGTFVTGYLVALALSPAIETTAEGRSVVTAVLGVLVGGLLTYEFVAGFYRCGDR